MLENRNLKHDLWALALLAVTVFLGLAVISYNPSDRVGELAFPLSSLHSDDLLTYPASDGVSNLCGRWGALAANLLLDGMGIGSYYALGTLGVLCWFLLTRQEVSAPIVRTCGWVASLLGIVTITAILAPGMSPGPVIGSGGYLGAMGHTLLEAHFATAGGLIIAGSVLLGGLLLCTDYLLVKVGMLAGAGVMQGAVVAGRTLKRRRSDEDTEAETAEEDEYEAEEDEEEVSIVIGGRRAKAEPVEAEEEEDEYEEDELEEDEADEEEDEEQAAEDEAPAKGRKKLLPGLRIRRPPAKTAKPAKTDKPAAAKADKKKPDEAAREEVIEQLNAAAEVEEPRNYELPSTELLLDSDDVCYEEQNREVRRKAKVLEQTFQNFGFKVKVVEIETGPVIAQYEVELEAGLRLSRITGLSDDLAIALRVPSVRIVAPIPGKNTVGIEVPNENRQVVRLREVMEESNGRVKKMNIPLFLGKDVSGNPLTVDLATLPHLLIAGRTGTGKSVCLNSIINSILMTRTPDEVRMLMIDPKMVELSGYKTLPHLMHPVVTDMRKAEAILAWAVEKMEERYALLAKAGVRHLNVYNQLGHDELIDRIEPETDEERQAIPSHLPYIVIVADEIADLMMTAGKEVEQHIIRLAQKSRAVGIHLILATQKPTVDVITGLIKSNLPARIAFQVASRTDSRVVLDEMGADKLLGNGDMLFLWPGTSTLLRGQGTYLGDDEINSVVDFVSTGEQNFVKELVHLKPKDEEGEAPGALKNRDDLYEAAVDIVVREGRGSVSLLQRTLGIGYGRAARLVDFMAEDGIVGQYAGSQAREVLISVEDWTRMQGEGGDSGSAPEPSPPPKAKSKRRNKVVMEDDWEEEEEESPAKPAKGKKAAATAQLEEEEEEEYEEDEYEDDEYEEDDEADSEEDEYEEEDAEEEDEYEDDEEEEYEDDESEEEEDEYEEEEEYAEADEDDEPPTPLPYKAESA